MCLRTRVQPPVQAVWPAQLLVGSSFSRSESSGEFTSTTTVVLQVIWGDLSCDCRTSVAYRIRCGPPERVSADEELEFALADRRTIEVVWRRYPERLSC